METEITVGGGVSYFPKNSSRWSIMTGDGGHDLESKFIREAKRIENKAGVIAKQLRLDKVKVESGDSQESPVLPPPSIEDRSAHTQLVLRALSFVSSQQRAADI